MLELCVGNALPTLEMESAQRNLPFDGKPTFQAESIPGLLAT
jgi:hypothetical protein